MKRTSRSARWCVSLFSCSRWPRWCAIYWTRRCRPRALARVRIKRLDGRFAALFAADTRVVDGQVVEPRHVRRRRLLIVDEAKRDAAVGLDARAMIGVVLERE